MNLDKTEEEMIEEMKEISHAFYRQAVQVGFHQFIEFAGFMNEYIQILESTVKAGKSIFEGDLEIKPYEAEYIGEKFGCIFGPVFEKYKDDFLKGIEK